MGDCKPSAAHTTTPESLLVPTESIIYGNGNEVGKTIFLNSSSFHLHHSNQTTKESPAAAMSITHLRSSNGHVLHNHQRPKNAIKTITSDVSQTDRTNSHTTKIVRAALGHNVVLKQMFAD